MIHTISTKVVDRLSTQLNLSDRDKARAIYSLEVIITDLSKFFILLSIFSIFDYGIELIIIYVFSALLRFNIGGFHIKTYVGCLAFTAVYSGSVIVFSQLIHMESLVATALGALALVCIYFIAPVSHGRRKELSLKNHPTMKRNGIIIGVVYLIISQVISYPVALAFFWILLIQTILILFTKGRDLLC
jgi:accessory gene regulator B